MSKKVIKMALVIGGVYFLKKAFVTTAEIAFAVGKICGYYDICKSLNKEGDK